MAFLRINLILFLIIIFKSHTWATDHIKSPFIIILGVAQDGGYPHMGCTKTCCTNAWQNPTLRRDVVSFALVDPISKKWYLFEATPDIKNQLNNFQKITKKSYSYLPDGIFLTHAHIGHYTGLMQLGREVMASKKVNVYVLPKFKAFLAQNGPWSQLVKLQNINLIQLTADVSLSFPNLSIVPFTVPHRDEYSETAGFKIITPTKKYLFIPDIDKWSKWDRNIIEEIKKVDVALLDATFYTNTELDNRPISEVPHPFVSETELLMINENLLTKQKVYFIHFNHTNPLLWDSKIQTKVKASGFNIATQGQTLK